MDTIAHPRTLYGSVCVYLFVMLRTHKDNIIISLLALPCEQTHVYHLFGYTHLAQTHTVTLFCTAAGGDDDHNNII